MEWEYTTKLLEQRNPVPDDPTISLVDWKESLKEWNDLGESGWELVQIIVEPDPSAMRDGIAVFKRPRD